MKRTRSITSISSGEISEESPPLNREIIVSVQLHNGISGERVTHKQFCLEGGDNECSLGSILGWAKKAEEHCTDVKFRNRVNGHMISCAELPYAKLRCYIENRDMPTENHPEKHKVVSFILIAWTHAASSEVT